MPVVEAVGAMGGAAAFGKANPVEQAMVAAIKQAQAEGITDPAVIRERIKKAIEYAQANG